MKHVSVTMQTRRPQPGHVLFCMFVGALLALLAPAHGVAQYNWTNHNSPVLSPGPGWESSWVEFVSVIYQDSQYVMWYSGADNTNGVNLSIGRATSPDGLNWTKDTLNPVMRHSPVGWPARAVWIPNVLKIGNAYTMWYTGASSSNEMQIGRATSMDGRAWVQDTTNPVIRVGAPGQWDAALVNNGSVLFDGATYRMWYTGLSQGYGQGTAGIGLATSADGIHWVKDTLDNPVLTAGPAPLAWDKDGVGGCSVVYDSTSHRYLMFYDGNEPDWFQPGTSGIGLATSTDGIHWVKDTIHNPVLPNNLPGSWTTVASNPFVLLRGSTLHMWYAGGNAVGATGYATAPRVVTGVAEYGYVPIGRDFHLQQNYPNPFNPSTNINYELPRADHVTLKVYDVLGQRVATLVDEYQEAGNRSLTFNANGMASGMYLYRLTVGSFVQSRKMFLLK